MLPQHGVKGVYVGGEWVDIEDCATRFHILNGSGDVCQQKWYADNEFHCFSNYSICLNHFLASFIRVCFKNAGMIHLPLSLYSLSLRPSPSRSFLFPPSSLCPSLPGQCDLPTVTLAQFVLQDRRHVRCDCYWRRMYRCRYCP